MKPSTPTVLLNGPDLRSADREGVDRSGRARAPRAQEEIVIHSLADTLRWLERLTLQLLNCDEPLATRLASTTQLLGRLNFVLDIFREQIHGRQMVLRALTREVDPAFSRALKRLWLDYESLRPFIDAVDRFAQRGAELRRRLPHSDRMYLLRVVTTAVDLTHQVILGEQETILRSQSLDVAATA